MLFVVNKHGSCGVSIEALFDVFVQNGVLFAALCVIGCLIQYQVILIDYVLGGERADESPAGQPIHAET